MELEPIDSPDDAPVMTVRDSQRFSLSDTFLEQFRKEAPPWGPLGEITYRRTYSRLKDDGKYEDWWETIARVVNGVYTYQKWHCKHLGLPWKEQKAQRSAQEMYRLAFGMKFLPPGRGLWMCGTPYVERVGSAALNNCAFRSTVDIDVDFAEPFCFLMDYSMLGVGVGGDCLGAGKITIKQPKVGTDEFVIPDTREGWVAIVRRVLEAYAGKATMPASINYNLVRPAGLPIKGFGGVSAGAEPLQRLVAAVSGVLEPLIGKPITGEAIVDLFDHIGVCVVSGNIRRSAIIMLGDPLDRVFFQLKDPELNAAALLSHRWASNNSIFAKVGMDYSRHAEKTAANGEPGYFWLDTARAYGRLADPLNNIDRLVAGINPCGEQSLESGELCCLVETFPSRHEDFDEYKRTLKFAYLYAKSVTLIPTHNPRTNAIVMRNRRIGCSQSGIAESFAKHGRREHLRWCDDGYKYLRQLDEMYADWLCIPRSKKITSVKPSGTVSLLPGVTPGIHYPHAEFYYRTIRVAKISPLVKRLEKAGYRIETDVADASSAVVYFPIHEEDFERDKHQVGMWEQLENAAALQYFWADNQVSATVTFKPDEAKDIGRALELYEHRLKSVTFLPLEDHAYQQAPYQTISASEYEEAVSRLKPINFRDSEHEQDDKFCDGDRCTFEPQHLHAGHC